MIGATMDAQTEFAISAETNTGDDFTIQRRSRARGAVGDQAVQGAGLRRVRVEAMPRPLVEISQREELNPDDPPPYPWTVQWSGGFAYIVDADGKEIASLLGSRKRQEFV